VLDRLARDTGGLSFRADRTARLGRIYDEIEAELRQQYLIGYQSDAAGGDEFRRVEVDVERPGVEVRTAPGYYP
jgi:VWFA-related protein